MFIVIVQSETIVYNKVKNRYEVSSIQKRKYNFKNQKKMISKMTSMNYEYKNNIYKNQSGWSKVSVVGSDKTNYNDHIIASTGLIYSKKES